MAEGKSWKRSRREAYPEICCQMGTVYLALKTLFTESGISVPTEVQAWFDAIEAVKSSNPKPEGSDNTFSQDGKPQE